MPRFITFPKCSAPVCSCIHKRDSPKRFNIMVENKPKISRPNCQYLALCVYQLLEPERRYSTCLGGCVLCICTSESGGTVYSVYTTVSTQYWVHINQPSLSWQEQINLYICSIIFSFIKVQTRNLVIKSFLLPYI
jgi:hypothetical protein